MDTYTKVIVATFFILPLVAIGALYYRQRQQRLRDDEHQKIFGFRPAKAYDTLETRIVKQKLIDLDRAHIKATEAASNANRQWRHGQIPEGEFNQFRREAISAAKLLDTAKSSSRKYGGAEIWG
jgi:hypothetical protein